MISKLQGSLAKPVKLAQRIILCILSIGVLTRSDKPPEKINERKKLQVYFAACVFQGPIILSCADWLYSHIRLREGTELPVQTHEHVSSAVWDMSNWPLLNKHHYAIR